MRRVLSLLCVHQLLSNRIRPTFLVIVFLFSAPCPICKCSTTDPIHTVIPPATDIPLAISKPVKPSSVVSTPVTPAPKSSYLSYITPNKLFSYFGSSSASTPPQSHITANHLEPGVQSSHEAATTNVGTGGGLLDNIISSVNSAVLSEIGEPGVSDSQYHKVCREWWWFARRHHIFGELGGVVRDWRTRGFSFTISQSM